MPCPHCVIIQGTHSPPRLNQTNQKLEDVDLSIKDYTNKNNIITQLLYVKEIIEEITEDTFSLLRVCIMQMC